MKAGDYFHTEFGDLLIKAHLGKGKSGNSYLVELNNAKYVLKIMHEEEVSYYKWNKEKLAAEVDSYKVLSKFNLLLPKLHLADYKRNFLIKDFIDGKIGSKLIAEGKIGEPHIKQLFEIAAKLEEHHYNIDYFPNNFVINKDKLFYIDYEHNPFNETWSWENWGIYYWANSEGFSKFLSTGDASYINKDLENGIPIKEPFQKIVNDWIEQFS